MKRLTTIDEMRRFSRAARREGLTIGFVPTMGALHQGHLSLVERSRRERDRTVVSVFVNPMQFAAGEDFERYPRDFDRDERILAGAGADALFAPSVEEMYPKGSTTVVEVRGLDAGLCGPFRPGHFRGVATIVAKLFNCVRPDSAYFGQKDAQQAAIVRAMARDLDMETAIAVCDTVRESDGLAMSSRNAYLTSDERRAAPSLYAALQSLRARALAGESSPARLRQAFDEALAGTPFRIEYLEIVDPDSLRPVENARGDLLIATAAWIGRTRLIDNILVATPR